jgi:hypothetical protein
MTLSRSDLQNAYLQTDYLVLDEKGDIVLCIHIGKKHPELDDMLKGRTWTFITAWNPRSEPQLESVNTSRQEQLVQDLKDMGRSFLPGLGKARDGHWEEDSLLAVDISREDAKGLGMKYGQNAIVYGEPGGTAQLIMLV